MMLTGLDRLASDPALAARLRKKRLGLVAHPASVTREMIHVSAVFAGLGLRPEIIFGPEHGYGGEAQDMIGIEDARDASGIRVKSLYGESPEDLSPRDLDLRGLDEVVIDLQDVGSRYYTFVWTAVLVLRACAKLGIAVTVLDRPNPLGAASIEGRAQDPEFRSFVGLEPIPIRHGLTLGEIVAWRREVEGLPEEMLRVFAATGFAPDASAPAWDRPVVMPSPNMPTYETMLVYPGGCLLEGTNLSDGRGTTRPFEITGAPWLSGARLATELRDSGLPGFVARPLTFRPTFHKHAGKTCGGVQIHVVDPAAFRPVETYAALIALAHHQSPNELRFRTEKYEFVDHIPAFDLLTGNAEARTRILAGDDPCAVARAVSSVTDEDRRIVSRARRAGEAASNP